MEGRGGEERQVSHEVETSQYISFCLQRQYLLIIFSLCTDIKTDAALVPLTGLNTVYSHPEETLSVDSFLEGATHPVNATFSASCCVRTAEVIGRDRLGNIGKCQWDLGVLAGKETKHLFLIVT